MSVSKLLVIDDNPDFGGHQVMFGHALEGIVESKRWEVLGLLHSENDKNRERWAGVRAGNEGLFRIENSPTKTRKFQSIRNRIEGAIQERLLKKVEEFNPDIILAIQGNIEHSSPIFSLKSRLSCPLLSYIPVPHKHAEMGAKLGGIRDYFCRRLYGIPDGFITIAPTLARMLERYGAKGRIKVVENGIPLGIYEDVPDKLEMRKQFKLPEDAFIWGHIGRVEFKQKGQDFCHRIFRERRKVQPDEHLVFLGSGPDMGLLEGMVKGDDSIHLFPWMDRPSEMIAALDAIVMPSRYEGVPLVMLEALASGVPVIATDRDGMCDWLPDTWRFSYRDEAEALKAMDVIEKGDGVNLELLKQRVFRDCSLGHFQKEFLGALSEWL